MNEEIQARYNQVLEEIERTVQKTGRSRDEITLVVVTKGHPTNEIEAIYQMGVLDIGENRPAEALEKQSLLPDLTNLNWHMIGHIQSRKAAAVAGKFTLVHSLDSVKLARRLSRFAGEAGMTQEVLLQFNTSGEASKSGFNALEGTAAPEVDAALEEILSLPSLRVRGLMTMAPWGTDPEIARPVFSALRRLRDDLASRFLQADWSHLSMGMSGDYKVAIQEGATLLRIGTAIIGHRHGAD